MLHILWILIKFILVVLGILLGLALLAVLLLLFCPVRYRAQAVKETDSFKETEAEARVTWLFQAICARFSFHNGEGKLVITLFGVSVESIKGWLGKLKGNTKKRSGSRYSGSGQMKKSVQTKETPPKNRKTKPAVKDSAGEEQKPEGVEDEEIPKQIPETPIEIEQKVSQSEMASAKDSQAGDAKAEKVQQENKPAQPPAQKQVETVQLENTSIESQTMEQSVPEQEKDTEANPKPGLFARIREILSKIIWLPGNIWNKIISIIRGIIEKIRTIKKTLSSITGKLNWWNAFLTNERTKAALSLVWKDAKGLIHHVLPTKVEGAVTFDCEDPSITGAVLAILGMTFPFHKNRIQVTPLFEGENQLTGNVSLKGRIYGIMFIKAAIEIYFNKNIKYVINRWKHKED